MDFMSGKIDFEFSLDLVLRIAEATYGVNQGTNIPLVCIVNCPFKIKKLPWTYALPWNRKK